MDKRKITLDRYTGPYTEAYQKLCKTTWYKMGRVDNPAKLLPELPEDEYGRKPNIVSLKMWREEQGWDVWADELDVRVEMEMDDFLVAQRIKMLKEHASRAREMSVKGMDYLRETGFDSSSSAVNAIVQGAKMEKVSRGISERIEKLLTLGDDDLTKEAMKLLGQAKESGEILDIETEDIEDDEETDS